MKIMAFHNTRLLVEDFPSFRHEGRTVVVGEIYATWQPTFTKVSALLTPVDGIDGRQVTVDSNQLPPEISAQVLEILAEHTPPSQSSR